MELVSVCDEYFGETTTRATIRCIGAIYKVCIRSLANHRARIEQESELHQQSLQPQSQQTLSPQTQSPLLRFTIPRANKISAMSFGFSVGDFLAGGTLVWKVYNAYAGAPEQFRNVSQEILSLHVVFNKVEDQLRNQGFGNNTLRLGTKDTDDLKILHDGLQTIVEKLDALLQKYHSLMENRSISFDRLRWGQEDLSELRERVIAHVGLLTAFNTSLMAYANPPFNFQPYSTRILRKRFSRIGHP